MPQRTTRLILAPAVLIAGLGAAACGASSPTAPQLSAAELGPGRYTLMVFGTATCVGNGDVPSSVAVPVTLSPGTRPGAWVLSAQGQPLTGEVSVENGAVQGFVRGTALVTSVRFSTGDLPDSTVAFHGAPSQGRYEGVVLAGTPRYEGIGAASGAATTCMSNGFALKPA